MFCSSECKSNECKKMPLCQKSKTRSIPQRKEQNLLSHPQSPSHNPLGKKKKTGFEFSLPGKKKKNCILSHPPSHIPNPCPLRKIEQHLKNNKKLEGLFQKSRCRKNQEGTLAPPHSAPPHSASAEAKRRRCHQFSRLTNHSRTMAKKRSKRRTHVRVNGLTVQPSHHT